MVTDRDGIEFDSAAEMRMGSAVDGLGWCGCGQPEEVRWLLVAYLSAVDSSHAAFQGAPLPGPGWDAFVQRAYADLDAMERGARLILAYVCDAAGWTEHGTSVNSAWLTGVGRAALDDLRQ